MPIVALEGPDRCGKSTLFAALQNTVFSGYAKFVRMDFDKCLQPVATLVGAREEQLWRQLYDSRTLYVLDRSFCVTPLVYDKLYGRVTKFKTDPWMSEHILIGFNTPLSELRRRHAASDEWFDVDRYEEVLELYRSAYCAYTALVLDWQLAADKQAAQVVSWVVNRMNERQRRPNF